MLLSKFFSVCMMLVVMFLTTGQSFITENEADTCCSKKTEKQESRCGESSEKDDCSNEGNPFQFCHCCPHIWAPPASASIQPASYLAKTVNSLQQISLLPEGLSSDFWQPPRFS